MIIYEIEKIVITNDQVAYDNTLLELNDLKGCLAKLFSKLERHEDVLYHDDTKNIDDSYNQKMNLIDFYQFSIQEIKKEIWNTEFSIKNKTKELNKLVVTEKWVLLKNDFIIFNFSSLFKNVELVEKLGDEVLIITYADSYYAIVNYEGEIINYKILMYEILQNNLILLEKHNTNVIDDKSLYQIIDFTGKVIIDYIFSFSKFNENLYKINGKILYSSIGNYIGDLDDFFIKNDKLFILFSSNNLKGLYIENEMVLKPEFDLIRIQDDKIIMDKVTTLVDFSKNGQCGLLGYTTLDGIVLLIQPELNEYCKSLFKD